MFVFKSVSFFQTHSFGQWVQDMLVQNRKHIHTLDMNKRQQVPGCQTHPLNMTSLVERVWDFKSSEVVTEAASGPRRVKPRPPADFPQQLEAHHRYNGF